MAITKAIQERPARKLFIGIDPGSSSGALAAIDEVGFPVLFATMPDSPAGIVAVLRDMERSGSKVYATIERVRAFAMPGRRMGATSAFAFGANVGALHAALHAAGIPYDEVEPATWQKSLNCVLPKGEKAQRARKEALNIRARQLFPKVEFQKRMADALLIAEYLRRNIVGR